MRKTLKRMMRAAPLNNYTRRNVYLRIIEAITKKRRTTK
jgi:hypothetical protein